MKFCKECGALTTNPARSQFCPACKKKRDRECGRRYIHSPRGREHKQLYENLPYVREKKKLYSKRPEVRERARLLAQQPGAKEKQKLYQSRPEVKAKKRVYYHEWASRLEVAEKLREYQENYHEQVRVPRIIKHVMQRALKLGFTRKTAEAYVMDGAALVKRQKELDAKK